MITPGPRESKSGRLQRIRWRACTGWGRATSKIGLLPSAVPAFTDSATNLNAEYRALVPQLQAEFPDAVIHLSDWGPDYDDIIANPSKYGITNTTDP